MPDLGDVLIVLTGQLTDAVSIAAKIRAILSADGSNFVIQISDINTGALHTNDESLAMIAEWKAQHPGVE